VETGLVESRTKAQALIMAGQVKVKDHPVTKVGTTVTGLEKIEIEKGSRYVSRGGEKLEGALQDFGVFPQGQRCLDVGSSTGGFTDCLLQHGAKHIFAIDVGRGQMVDPVRSDPRVTLHEKTHICDVDPALFTPQPALAVVDVSFISLKKVLPKLLPIVEKGGTLLVLFKPQFEVGPKHLKKGIVKSEDVTQMALRDMIQFIVETGFEYLGQSASHLKGAKGNQEYFLFLKNKS